MSFARTVTLAALVLSSAAALAAPKAAAPKAPEAAAKTVVEMKTSAGLIKIELDAEKAPISVKNFLEYVDAKHYDGTIFHRVINGFMIQGGGFTKDMTEKKTRGGIKNESQNGLKNAVGTIAMARTNIPDSATSQFYINVNDNKNLDFPSFDGVGYAVFGKVTEGMDVVNKIKAMKTGNKNGMGDVPVETITIESVRRAK